MRTFIKPTFSFTLFALLFALFGSAPAFAHRAGLVGNVYAMDNNPQDNRLVVYGRFANGELRLFGSVAGGGTGGGDTETPISIGFDPIGTQDPLVVSDDGKFAYMVNVGDNTLSVFFLTRTGRPLLLQTLDSAGNFPASILTDENRVYVLNLGEGGNIAVFKRQTNGRLQLINDGVYPLNLGTAGPPQGFDRVLLPGDLALDPLRRRLVMSYANGGEDANVPELPGVGTGEIWSWPLDNQGMISGDPEVVVSRGLGPFSLAFTPHGHLLVSEAFTNSVSLYDFTTSGAQLTPLIGPVLLSEQVATCWIRTIDSGFAFVTNSFTDTISSYRYTRTGSLTLHDEHALTSIGQPVDFAITDDQRFMYVATSTEGGVRAIRVNAATGELSSIATYPGLPIFAEDGYAPAGLAIR